ncbi:hypothetical protein IJI31_01175 [bacterium]|nr:hypothetical protein [bacterium]
MKKIVILICCLLGISLNANAMENYILLSDNEISEITTNKDGIVDVSNVVTLTEGTSVAIIKCLKEGRSEFQVKNGDKVSNFAVNVTKKNAKISNNSGYHIVTLDCPPELPSFDLPPVLKEVK